MNENIYNRVKDVFFILFMIFLSVLFMYLSVNDSSNLAERVYGIIAFVFGMLAIFYFLIMFSNAQFWEEVFG